MGHYLFLIKLIDRMASGHFSAKTLNSLTVLEAYDSTSNLLSHKCNYLEYHATKTRAW